MITALDTNVLIALWDTEPDLSLAAQTALDSAASQGRLALAGPVYAELLAMPGRHESTLDGFLSDTSIIVDWVLGEAVWRLAGRAFQEYMSRRSVRRPELPRRILADFLIGAHAVVNGYRLLTLDKRLYRASFPKLEMVSL